MSSCARRNGGEVEASFAFVVFTLLWHPPDSDSETVIVCSAELVATTAVSRCLPFLPITGKDLSLATGCGFIISSSTYQCNNVPRVLLFLHVLGVVLLRSQNDHVIVTEAMLRLVGFQNRFGQTRTEVGRWNDLICRYWSRIGTQSVEL